MSQKRLFFASCSSLATCGALFAIRSAVQTPLADHFHAAPSLIGDVMSMGFYGMGYVIAFASPLCDFLGMRALMLLAFTLQVIGTAGFLFVPGTATDQSLFWAKSMVLLLGLAHGLIEAVINPLIATLYPDHKTHKLNVLHAWWPGGIILGGLTAWGLRESGVSWQVQWICGFVPMALYGLSILGAQFPKTERVASGVSASSMITAALNPLFLLFVAMMAVTAATELGTGQWLDTVLTKTAGFGGILLLCYGSGLMFALRFFAGPIAHRVSPIGLLAISAALAACGLYLLSHANSPASAIVAATLFYVGVCYFWPTMLAVISERHPKAGALGMGMMAASGFLGSAYFIQWFGSVYDEKDPAHAFERASLLPAGLFVVFTLLFLMFRARGGYKVEKLDAPVG